MQSIQHRASNWHAHIILTNHHYSVWFPPLMHFHESQCMVIYYLTYIRGVGSVNQHSLSNPTTCRLGGGLSLEFVEDISITIRGG